MLRRYFRLFLLACLGFQSCFCLVACADDDELHIAGLEWILEQNANRPPNANAYFQNHPLPVGQNHLRVLAIGNSFSSDALCFVSEILSNLGVDTDSYSAYGASHNAATLEHWCEVATQKTTVELTHFGGAKMEVEIGTLQEILAQQWDVIILLQYSYDAIKYDTYNPWLHQLIDLIQQHCTNPKVTLAWHMPWSYDDTFITDYTNYERWLLITLAVQEMMWNDGIDVIIPVGTAIQNARTTSLNAESQLTSDGWHLDHGIGRYIAACTLVQAIFEPVYGISILGNTAMPDMGEQSPTRYVSVPVTEENRSICQSCAVNAVLQPFKVTTL